MTPSIWIGWDPREAAAFAVARASILERLVTPVPVHGVIMGDLRKQGIYDRPHLCHVYKTPDGHDRVQLWDVISNAPMATEFACSRFLVPELVRRSNRSKKAPRWALFMDCDMLVRQNLTRLFEGADPTKAVLVVKHNHNPTESVKMDNQIQTRYARKNWSSVVLFNVDHPANDSLTPEMVNSLPGRDLHAFCWLKDEDIGELDPKWNFLVGHTDPSIDPAIVHFTDGIPSMPGYENCAFADEWRAQLQNWAR